MRLRRAAPTGREGCGESQVRLGERGGRELRLGSLYELVAQLFRLRTQRKHLRLQLG